MTKQTPHPIVHGKVPAVSWGNQALDRLTNGLPAGDICIMETSDFHAGTVALGKFIFDGLQKGEKAAIVTFDTPEVFLENFNRWNMDFEKYLNEEQFFFLHYQPTIKNDIGLTQSYNILFEEIIRLCRGNVPVRLAFQQIDLLINLNNIALINSCVQKLVAAAQNEITAQTTILGSFVQFEDKTHQNLAISLQKLVSGYFSLKELKGESQHNHYEFMTKKIPWFSYKKEKSTMYLREGEGLVEDLDTKNTTAA